MLSYPSYSFQRWHGTLLLYAVLLVTLFVNTVAVRILPALEGVILILHVLGFLAILIPLVHLAPISSTEFVFTAWSNSSGYPDGLSWFVGLTTSSVLFVGMYSILTTSTGADCVAGFDGACHMGRY